MFKAYKAITIRMTRNHIALRELEESQKNIGKQLRELKGNQRIIGKQMDELLKMTAKSLSINQETAKQYVEILKTETAIKTNIDAFQKQSIETLKGIEKKTIGLSDTAKNIDRRVKKLEIQHEYEFFSKLPEAEYPTALSVWYESKTNRTINIQNPKTYNEKIQWMKLYEKNPMKTRLADKYAVREWVTEKIGQKYLIPLVGVYEKFEDINFEVLPNKFVIKCNHGAAMNIIIKDKSTLDLIKIRRSINDWLHTNFAYRAGLELHYRDIIPKIIIEEYIENANGELNDYKIWCFNGKVEYICIITDRSKGAKTAFFDVDWNLLPFTRTYPRIEKIIERPVNLTEMIEVSEKLSQGFNHVRVDLYSLDNGTVKFGEMTFTAYTGIGKWDPPEYDEIIGAKFDVQ